MVRVYLPLRHTVVTNNQECFRSFYTFYERKRSTFSVSKNIPTLHWLFFVVFSMVFFVVDTIATKVSAYNNICSNIRYWTLCTIYNRKFFTNCEIQYLWKELDENRTGEQCHMAVVHYRQYSNYFCENGRHGVEVKVIRPHE